MTNSPHDVVLVVRIPQELRDQLKGQAALENRSSASVVRRAIRQYLAEGSY